ncbi:cytochrome c biogenesis CcdA family protein [Schaalia suimastitidis]|uniref:cytochrome c biogenesis CcdA family protein n=1 Tax=Schaalia suimastitidis TaxID=121163 RepID=UPI00041D6545|nr:cytochrome c biogenesis protein CcdA [Schaalia suimastitidis]
MGDIPALAALLGGALTLFAPCSALLLPAFFAHAFAERRTLIVRTVLFWCGLLTTLVPLGVMAGSLGAYLRTWEQQIAVGAGTLIILLGVAQIFAVDPFFFLLRRRWRRSLGGVGPRPGTVHASRLPQMKEIRAALTSATDGGPSPDTPIGLAMPAMDAIASAIPAASDADATTSASTPDTGRLPDTDTARASALSVYLMGLVYGFAGVGCAGPILGAVLLSAGIGGSVTHAVLLVVLYATGMTLPLVLLSLLWSRLARARWIRPRSVSLAGRSTTWMNVVSGLLFIAVGLFFVAFGAHSPLPSLVDGGRLASWESVLLQGLAALPAWLPWTMLVLTGIAVVLLAAARRPSSPDTPQDIGSRNGSTHDASHECGSQIS